MRVDPITAVNDARALGAVGPLPARTGVDPALARKFAALMQAEPKALAAEDRAAGDAHGWPAHLFLGQLRA